MQLNIFIFHAPSYEGRVKILPMHPNCSCCNSSSDYIYTIYCPFCDLAIFAPYVPGYYAAIYHYEPIYARPFSKQKKESKRKTKEVRARDQPGITPLRP